MIDGLEADVVTLALEGDINTDRRRPARSPPTGRRGCRNNSTPYTSTIVFLVRKGNPKGIKDWGDLIKDGVEVITPNPKTSGGARWNYLAAWAYANAKFGGDEAKNMRLRRRRSTSTCRCSTPARAARPRPSPSAASATCCSPGRTRPSSRSRNSAPTSSTSSCRRLSILAEPPVAVVDGNVDAKGTREVAEAYLEYLYSDEAQKIIAKHFYRPAKPDAADPEDLERFPKSKLVTIDDPLFGGWAKAQPKYFADGGIFDQIYKPQRRTERSRAWPAHRAWRSAKPSVIPGFGLALGFTLTYLSLIVLIPLAALVLKTASLGLAEFWQIATDPRTLAALQLSFGASLLAAADQRRLRPDRRLGAGPLSTSPAAGCSTPSSTCPSRCRPRSPASRSPRSMRRTAGSAARSRRSASRSPTRRSASSSRSSSSACPSSCARSSRCSRTSTARSRRPPPRSAPAGCQTVFRVILPALLPALLTGFALAFARAVGEYGSVIFIAGNMPFVSEIAPLLIVIRLEEFDYAGGDGDRDVMLVISFVLLLVDQPVQAWSRTEVRPCTDAAIAGRCPPRLAASPHHRAPAGARRC